MRATGLGAALIGFGGLATLAACGPMPVRTAETQCLDAARKARAFSGEIGLGAGSGGRALSRVELNLNTNMLNARDPSAVFDACVMRKAGQPPHRPLHMIPDWKG